MIAAQDTVLANAAPWLIALWAVYLLIIFVGPRVSEALVRRLSGAVVWVLVGAVALSVLAALAAALSYSWFWLAVVIFVSLLMIGFATPVLVARAGERVFTDRRPPAERVVAHADDGRDVTEDEEAAAPARDAGAFESVLAEQEEDLHPGADRGDPGA